MTKVSMSYLCSFSRYQTKCVSKWGLTASAPLKPPPQGAKFTSQVDACVRTDAQIKFLYYPHLCTFYPPGKQTRDFVIMDRCAKH